MRKIRIGSKVIYLEWDSEESKGIVREQVRKDDGIWYYLVDKKGEGLGYFDEVWLPPTKRDIFRERCERAFKRWYFKQHATPEEWARRDASKKVARILEKGIMF